jgi:hypothetical protein
VTTRSLSPTNSVTTRSNYGAALSKEALAPRFDVRLATLRLGYGAHGFDREVNHLGMCSRT